ncbi:MAG: Rpn family recombination-promoting nuclease/putative transposase [Cyanobium sp.]
MVASDKLFFWLFQERSDRLLPLVSSLLDDMEGYSFTAPVIKEREVRPDGLFLPPLDQLQEKPAVIMEAQMAANPEFYLRLYNGSSLLLMHQFRQGQPVRYWRVLVFCPSRDLNFGDPIPVAEFLRERVIWIELAPERMPPSAPPLQKALGLLLLPEEQLPASAAAIREQASATPLATELDDVIAAILLSRFNGRSITDICAMGGITLDDFTNSVAYKEIFGRGLEEGQQQGRLEGWQEGKQEGRQEGRQAEAAAMTQRLLQRRFGSLAPDQQVRIQGLPLAELEALADALLDFQTAADLTTWLAQRHG